MNDERHALTAQRTKLLQLVRRRAASSTTPTPPFEAITILRLLRLLTHATVGLGQDRESTLRGRKVRLWGNSWLKPYTHRSGHRQSTPTKTVSEMVLKSVPSMQKVTPLLFLH